MKWEEVNKPEGVSLCMITRNEETNPAGGIESFLKIHIPMVDEVVLIDTGSKDRTIKIAKGFDKVNVYNYHFDGSFSNARNFSLDRARYNHILILDADERLLLPWHKKTIESILHTEQGNLFGYEFVFIDVPQDGIPMRRTNHGDEGYKHRVRYFMNLPCLRFSGNVHEQLQDTTQNYIGDFICGHMEVGIIVKHFLPSEKILKEKQQFYEKLERNRQ